MPGSLTDPPEQLLRCRYLVSLPGADLGDRTTSGPFQASSPLSCYSMRDLFSTWRGKVLIFTAACGRGPHVVLQLRSAEQELRCYKLCGARGHAHNRTLSAFQWSLGCC